MRQKHTSLMLGFSKKIISHFSGSDTFQKGAALAYYTAFSILPILVIVISILGFLFGEEAVSGDIYAQLSGIIGEKSALQIQEIIKNQHINHNNILTTIIGFGTLAFSASGMFTQIQRSFNNIWDVQPRSKNSFLKYITDHFLSFIFLIILFSFLLISTSINGILTKYGNTFTNIFQAAYIYEHFISFVISSFVFSIMFKLLGDAKIPWKLALAGGVFTATFFIIGKFGISLYISNSSISSTFGSASILALIMIWVYYTSQIIFLGASFIKVLSEELGLQISPDHQTENQG